MKTFNFSEILKRSQCDLNTSFLNRTHPIYISFSENNKIFWDDCPCDNCECDLPTTTISSNTPTTSPANTTVLIIYDYRVSRRDNYLLYLDGGKISFIFLDRDIIIELLKCGYSSIIISYKSKYRTRNDSIYWFQKILTSTNI